MLLVVAPQTLSAVTSPLHHAAGVARDVLAIWGGISLIFFGIGRVLSWRNHRREKRERRLEQKIYRFLLDSNESHNAGVVWAEIVIKPVLEGVKLKYAFTYEKFPGWKIQLGIIYWTVVLWWRKLGAPSENDVAAILAEMHHRGEVQVTHNGMYRIVNPVGVSTL